ncbi:MAG TPA: alginate lyase family protein, partial [Niabella sp.]|nr:alginate lyase family protein [Niabella sp.]
MRKICWVVLILLASKTGLQAQWLWDAKKMHTIKSRLTSLTYASAYSALMAQADRDLGRNTYSVVQKKGVAPSGDKHDYVSLSRYWWPNPNTADGLPYVYKDGQSNPELERYDRNTLGDMCAAVKNLSLAFFYSGEEKYAQKAVKFLRAWFLDKATLMNPNLEYSQFIPGKDNSKGRPEGLIDSYSFVELLNSIQLLKTSKSYTTNDEEGLKRWFGRFAKWLQESQQGKKEKAAKNNHATAYDSQMIYYLLFSGNEPAARDIINDFASKRIFAQIEPDGKQPNELWRTLAYHYSQYNLSHMLDVCAVARKLGIN